MNVISGRISHTSGELRFNGNALRTNKIKQFCAYVQQKDLFLKNLTVEEHLDTQISLRLGRVAKSQRRALIDQIIHRFQLVPCRRTVIGCSDESGISGGERKRLNIASEFLTNPMVLLTVK